MTEREEEHKGVLGKIKSKVTGEKKSDSESSEPVNEKEYRKDHESDYR